MKEALRLAPKARRLPRNVDFADDLRRARTQRNVSMDRMMDLFARLGVRFRTEGPKRRHPCQSVPRLGFFADTDEMRVELEESYRRRGQDLWDHVMMQSPLF